MKYYIAMDILYRIDERGRVGFTPQRGEALGWQETQMEAEYVARNLSPFWLQRDDLVVDPFCSDRLLRVENLQSRMVTLVPLEAPDEPVSLLLKTVREWWLVETEIKVISF